MVEEVILKHKSSTKNFIDNHIPSKIEDRKDKIQQKKIIVIKSSVKPCCVNRQCNFMFWTPEVHDVQWYGYNPEKS